MFMKELATEQLARLKLTIDEWDALLLMWEQSKRERCPVGSFVGRNELDMLVLAGLVNRLLVDYELSPYGLTAAQSINMISEWDAFAYRSPVDLPVRIMSRSCDTTSFERIV